MWIGEYTELPPASTDSPPESGSGVIRRSANLTELGAARAFSLDAWFIKVQMDEFPSKVKVNKEFLWNGLRFKASSQDDVRNRPGQEPMITSSQP